MLFREIQICYQNVRGLRTKTSIFHNNVTQSEYDMIALTETFLTSSVSNGELFPPGFHVVRKDRPGDCGWGGVLLAIRDHYIVKIITDIVSMTDDKELIFAIVTFKNVKVLCCVVYLPPNYTDEQYLNVLTCIENVICTYSDLNVLILGDFNLNSCSTNIKTTFDYFCEFCSLKQYNTVLNNRGGMLDLVLGNFEPNQIAVSHSEDPLVNIDQYHPMLDIIITYPGFKVSSRISSPQQVTPRSDTSTDWKWRKADFQGLYNALAEVDWSDLLTINDINCAVQLFYDKLYEIIRLFVPTGKRLSNNQRYTYPKWYNVEIIKNIQNKHFHHKKFKKEGKEFNKAMFIYYREKVKKLIDCEYRKHMTVLQKNIIDDPVQFWKYVKDRKKDRRNINTYTYENTEVTDQAAADAFAEYFASVFHAEKPVLNPDTAIKTAYAYIHRDVASVSITTVDGNDLKKAVRRLKPRSAGGPDGIPVFLVRDCISVIGRPLLYLYNLSLTQSRYPESWKLSRVTPVPKGDGGADVTSFRPIAVLSVFGKIFEAILSDRINCQIGHQLHNSQHGFRTARSTTTNLVSHVDYICAQMDKRMQVDAAYFDFKKAFDLVDNDLLLEKLAIIGFVPKLLNFFSCYLNNRRQYVRLNSCDSGDYFTRSGVSQGSTLGPLLFLIFINDLPDVVLTSECLLFADDLKLTLGIETEADADTLQKDIDAVSVWSQENHLPFNTFKCKIITFTRKSQPIIFNYKLSDASLERVYEIRDLGLVMDYKLDFHTHINKICKSAYKMLGFVMRTASQFDNVRVARVLYNAYVRSKLEYAAVIWNPYEEKYILMIEKIQRKFARWIYKKQYGYYPYLYPSLFVSGMVDMETLKFRRAMSEVIQYLSIIHNRIDSPQILERVRIMVPVNVSANSQGQVAPRRRPRLLEPPRARTERARQAPTNRALRAIGNILAQHNELDLFADGLAHLCNEFQIILNKTVP